MSTTYPVPVNLHSESEAEAYRRHIRQTRLRPAPADTELADGAASVDTDRSVDHALVA